MSKSIVEFTPVINLEDKGGESDFDTLYSSIQILKRDLVRILSDFEKRLKSLEAK